VSVVVYSACMAFIREHLYRLTGEEGKASERIAWGRREVKANIERHGIEKDGFTLSWKMRKRACYHWQDLGSYGYL
jgi:hypothetical protein